MTTPAAAVVIPWRGGCPHREAALAWVLARWRTAGYEPVIGEAPAGPWCKAAAVADALPRTAGDVVVVADADVWCEGVEQAIAAVVDGAPWAIPHAMVHRLTEDATGAVLAGAPLGGAVAQRPYLGYPGGGITVVPRRTYERVPLDHRFAGWGQEDEAWALALAMLAGTPWRGSAPLWHLWHPPQQRDSRRWGSDASRALLERYWRASTPEAMRSVLDETEVRHGAGDH